MAGKTAEHLELMINVFRGMEQYCRSLSAELFEAEACKRGMMLYLESFSSLNALWRVGRPDDEVDRLPWHIRPKCHILQHLALDQIPIFGSPANVLVLPGRGFRRCGQTHLFQNQAPCHVGIQGAAEAPDFDGVGGAGVVVFVCVNGSPFQWQREAVNRHAWVHRVACLALISC